MDGIYIIRLPRSVLLHVPESRQLGRISAHRATVHRTSVQRRQGYDESGPESKQYHSSTACEHQGRHLPIERIAVRVIC